MNYFPKRVWIEKKAKIKIKFLKMKAFLDSIPWLKSHQPPMFTNDDFEI